MKREPKEHLSIRLSPHARRMLRRLTAQLGLSQSALIEFLIREETRRRQGYDPPLPERP